MLASGLAATPAATAAAPTVISPPPSSDTLYAGQTLVNQQSSLRSADSGFYLLLEGGWFGVFEQYPLAVQPGGFGGVTTWQSAAEENGVGNEATTLTLQTDGNLVLRRANGRTLWATYTYHESLIAGMTLPAGLRMTCWQPTGNTPCSTCGPTAA